MDNYLNQTLGNRYQIQEIIGIGGMSVVYKAYDPVDDRVVAVKILKDEFLANQEFRMRFKNESKAISMLSHPNIVKVFDVSFGDTLQYIVMEYVEGITLKEYIQRQRILDWKEAVHFVIQILRALQHAHDKGIVHRDIKPQNIILLPNANIKVTDFGIARFNRAESRNVTETSAIGSVHYVSPEQAKGEYTDGRSDIYSVGVVLYEMLTGRVPFESENDISVAMMQLRDDAPRPTSINPSIPAGLEQITLRALQKNPADRYQSAAEFLSDLGEFKKNPRMRFDYSYFIDKNPTKFIGAAAPAAAADASSGPVKILDEYEEENYEEDYEEDDDEETEERSLTVPILAGVAIALVLIVAIILFVAFGDTIRSAVNKNGDGASVSQDAGDSFWRKLDIFGWFSSDLIEVPNFINMNYDEAKSKYPDILFDAPQYVYNTTYEAGKIISQTPEAGEKVSKDSIIQLTIANNSDTELVPDVKGMDYEEAKEILEDKGFTVTLVRAFDDDTPENEVIYTDPSINTYTAYNSNIFVYYATSASDNVTGTRVPNVVGDQLSVARNKIVKAGLKVGAITYDSSSASLKDYVIGQNPGVGANVSLNFTVNLVVGNGIPDTGTATFSIKLPEVSGKKTGTIKTFLNNKAYDSKSKVALDGSSYTLSFTGSGDDNTFTIYVDSSKIYSGKIDFTKESGMVSDVVKYSYATRENIPDVTGMSQKNAQKALQEKGFNNIEIETVNSEDVEKGYVISQSPVSSSLTQYSTTVTVTLVVSAGAEEETTEKEETTLPDDTEETTVPDDNEDETTTKNDEESTTEAPTTEAPTVEETTVPAPATTVPETTEDTDN